jgi:RimJ/RimL family protein N-acetyltransferase
MSQNLGPEVPTNAPQAAAPVEATEFRPEYDSSDDEDMPIDLPALDTSAANKNIATTNFETPVEVFPWEDKNTWEDAIQDITSFAGPSKSKEGVTDPELEALYSSVNSAAKSWIMAPEATPLVNYPAFAKPAMPQNATPQHKVIQPYTQPYSGWSSYRKDRPIGMVYLCQPLLHSTDQVGELSIGIIIDKDYRCKGLAREAIQLLVPYAFEELKCHRIQALLVDSYSRERAMSLFVQT